MTDTDAVDDPRGYAEAFDLYFQAGWRSIIPLAAKTKYPTHAVKCGAAKAKRPDHVKKNCDICISYTGYDAVVPSYADMMTWADSDRYRDGNTSLKLPDGFIGIDVDAYGAKSGAATFAELVRRWGPLPRGPRSSSRQGDLTSGIRLFRVPPGTVLETIINLPELGVGDIEIVQPHHRYAVVWPSVHPEGGTYTWRDEADRKVDIPTPDSIPDLPQAWLDGLKVQPRAQLDDGAIRYDVRQALTPGQPSETVAARLRQAVKEMNMPGASRHDTCNRHVMALARLGKSGQPGVEHAMRILCDVLIALRSGDGSNTPDGTRGEFVRMLTNERISLELSQPGLTDWVGALVVEDLAANPPEVNSGPAPGLPSAEPERATNTDRPTGTTIVDDSAPKSDLEHIERGFWQSRESLAQIYQMALARMAPPWAALGNCATRALSMVPPRVTLPPLIGGPGSLNFFAATVARASGGKGASAAAANILVPKVGFRSCKIGSGEGIIAAFGRIGDEDSPPEHECIMFSTNEIDTLKALNGRSSSTTLPILREAFFGEELGFAYAAKDKRRHIPEHSYRMTFIVAAQPNRMDWLLADADGGTPQRFMWFPASDSRITRDKPWETGPLTLPAATEWIYPREIKIPREAIEEIETAAEKRARDEGDAIDGHALFCREKFAYALTVLDGRVHMTSEDWELSGIAADVSAFTREKSRDAVKAALVEEAVERGAIRGVEMESADVERIQQQVKRGQRVLKWLLHKLDAADDGWISQVELMERIAGRDRSALKAILEHGHATLRAELVDGSLRWYRA